MLSYTACVPLCQQVVLCKELYHMPQIGLVWCHKSSRSRNSKEFQGNSSVTERLARRKSSAPAWNPNIIIIDFSLHSIRLSIYIYVYIPRSCWLSVDQWFFAIGAKSPAISSPKHPQEPRTEQLPTGFGQKVHEIVFQSLWKARSCGTDHQEYYPQWWIPPNCMFKRGKWNENDDNTLEFWADQFSDKPTVWGKKVTCVDYIRTK